MATQYQNYELEQKISATEKVVYHPVTNAGAVEETEEKVFVSPTEKGQIDKNKTDIASLKTKTDTNNTDISGLKEAVSELESKNSEQDTNINSNKSRIDELEATVGVGGEKGTLVDRVNDLEDFADTKGVGGGLATLNANGKVPEAQLPDSVLGQLSYQGTWNANTNKFVSWVDYGVVGPVETIRQFGLTTTTSNFPSEYNQNTGYIDNTNKVYYPGIGTYFIVATAGIFNSVSYEVGDWIIFNGQGQGYAKVDNTDAVSSVAGLTGAVSVPNLKIALGIEKVNNTADADKEVKSATQLKNNKTFNVSGDVEGTEQNFNGTQNVVIPVTIKDDSVGETKIKDASVGESKLKDSAVTENKVADNAISESKIKDGAVSADKLANESVDSSKIKDGAVGTDELADGSISAAKIKNGAVTGAKLEDIATAGTGSVITYDSKGRVTSSASLITVYTGDTMPSSVPIGGFAIKVGE